MGPTATPASPRALRADPAPPGATTGSVKAGLVAAVAELERAARETDALQQALSPLLRRGGEGAQAGQALDALTQSLDGLGRFLSAMAQACPADWRIDLERAGATLTLSAQKDRLTGARASVADATPPGEPELW